MDRNSDQQARQTAARILGAAGGRKAAQRMTPEQRSERARKAAAARWGNRP